MNEKGRGRPHQEAAREVTTEVFEKKRPRPAQPFPAVAQVAEALLTAGHDRAAVVASMLAVPTISTRWCEAEIARGNAPPGSRLDTDRDGPSGRVQV